ncbi:hypothetical protein YC2023_099039 [Brassica napus]
MAPNKGTFLMICEQPVKSHFKGAEIVTFSEPWGKAAQATRHHIRVGKRAAGIHQGMPRFYHHFHIGLTLRPVSLIAQASAYISFNLTAMKLRCLESRIFWAQRNAERSAQHGICKFVLA